MIHDQNAFLCTLREIEDYEPGHVLGYQLRVEQFDGDCHYFADTKTQSAHQRAADFIELHGMHLVTEEQMDHARSTMG